MKIWLAIVLAGFATAAGAEMWKCINPDGSPLYINSLKLRADSKDCKAFNYDPPPAQPAPPRGQAAAHQIFSSSWRDKIAPNSPAKFSSRLE